MKSNIGVILAGGLGARFHSDIPKQYMKLNGNEVIAYSINAFKNSTTIDDFIVVVDQNEFIEKNIETKFNVKCILGGETRNHSLHNAILYIKENYPNCDNVLFHEAARPFIRPSIVDTYIQELEQHDAVITAVKITDSIGHQDKWIVDRQEYYLIQAPEAFKFDLLAKHFSPDSNITATVQQLPQNIKLKKYFDFKNNIKITYPEDLFLAEQLIKLSYYRKKDPEDYDYSKLGKVLIFGGSGGIGSTLIGKFKEGGVDYLAPTSKEVNLENIEVETLKELFSEYAPDTIINLAATSKSDVDGILENFDKVFHINLRASLVFIEFAKSLNKRVNLVLLSSSSSTKGRQKITLYSASKVGVNSIIESLSDEMALNGVYINGIIPEKIYTPMIDKLHKRKINRNEMLDVEEVIDAILYYSSCNEYGQLVHIRKGL